MSIDLEAIKKRNGTRGDSHAGGWTDRALRSIRADLDHHDATLSAALHLDANYMRDVLALAEAARADVPALLAEVDRLNGIIAELKQTGGSPVDEVWERWRTILARADMGSSHA